MNTTKPKQPDTKIKLTNARLSYPHLFVPQKAQGASKEKYGADFILNKKEHAALITQIEKTIERVALDFFKKKVTLKNVCLHDGNEREDKEGYDDEVMYIVAKNDREFPVVDKDPRIPLTAKSPKPYGGCYVNAIIRLFAYDHPTGGKGVSASLEAVQFVKDGESFGAGPVNAEDEFEPVTDDVDNY